MPDDATLDPAPTTTGWHVGDRIAGQYEITAIHRGGMGVVHRARHLGWDTDVAIKRPRPELFRTAADRDRFVREARTWIDLGLHPHVCNCHYVRTLDGVPHVVAEYVQGGSLADRIRDRRLYAGSGREVLARILDFAIQAAWGLAHAHALGVVHRDVKPANILVGADVKVTDFGLAGAAAGPYRGTRHYASPQQAAGEHTGPEGDVWSFAVSVLEMLTGEVTWLAGPAAGGALDGAAAAAPLEGVPGDLAELLARCLAWEPADRPGSMADIAAALIAQYTVAFGPYPRDPPAFARPRAAELNNRALSLLDLGQDEDAKRLLDEALAADPRHLEASFNSGVLRWRAGELTDDALLATLEAARANLAEPARADHLLEMVGAERGAATPTFGRPVGPRRTVAPVCVTPDGAHLLAADAAGAVHVVEAATGRRVRLLHGHRDVVDAIAVSSDGHRALTVSESGRSVLWDLRDGRPLRRRAGRGDVFHVGLAADAGLVLATKLLGDPCVLRARKLGRGPGHRLHTGARVTALCVSPDGGRALVGDASGRVRLWNPGTGAVLWSVIGHARPVDAMAMDSTGRRAVTVAADFEDFAARVWDLSTGRLLNTLGGHTGPLTSVHVSPDGRQALTGSGDHTARWWDLDTGRCLRVLSGATQIIRSAAFAGEVAATTELTGTVRIWELPGGRCLRTITEGTEFGDTALLTPDGRALVHAGRTAVRLWPVPVPVAGPLQISRSRTAVELLTANARVDDLLARAARAREPGDALDLVRRARGEPGHERSSEVMDAWHRLSPGAAQGELKNVWLSRVLDGGGKASTAVCATPDGHVLSAGHEEGAVWVWELASGRRVATLTGHGTRVLSAAATDQFAVAGAEDGTTRVWRLPTGRPMWTLRGHDGPVRAVTTTPGGRYAVTGSADGTARVWDLWDLSSGRPVAVLTGHPGMITGVATDGRSCFTAAADGSVRQWDLRDGRWTGVPETTAGTGLTSLCLTPDGLLLTVSFPAAKGVRVRDAETGRFVRALDPDGAPGKESVCTTPDGRIAVVTELAATVRLWEVATGRSLGHLEGLTGGVADVCVTPDGNHIVVAGRDGKLRIWALDRELEAPG
ncbi:protein kinase [Amycolatopsis sp. CA-128772]|uniref:protein kinase domain-containing protein n=1 Tax=Amycolatopsis sp. CA-128772 TaxID=2073159 RepID=UPI000CD0C555|nr:protein kinase [Amycolatopsis sp. CA-128772]